jgi:hypothetical protein
MAGILDPEDEEVVGGLGHGQRGGGAEGDVHHQRGGGHHRLGGDGVELVGPPAEEGAQVGRHHHRQLAVQVGGREVRGEPAVAQLHRGHRARGHREVQAQAVVELRAQREDVEHRAHLAHLAARRQPVLQVPGHEGVVEVVVGVALGPLVFEGQAAEDPLGRRKGHPGQGRVAGVDVGGVEDPVAVHVLGPGRGAQGDEGGGQGRSGPEAHVDFISDSIRAAPSSPFSLLRPQTSTISYLPCNQSGRRPPAGVTQDRATFQSQPLD